ncbi:type VII secretion protein EccB [Micromonospora zingiberis]|uniref:Type VII secretion protein EccB n=1 Tax=Micromonospora zingiberis TaxID=2053011 RepID=A0A4R0GFN9_9ACTN|nr:type VII secretion protein EccB [Micromonospora zingiberis]TCB95427.1 type VII secretion protein EccB [Micromonospora zingiberis]
MQTRRDQVQAQSYVLGRLTAALVSGEPDGLESPHRRMIVGSICGLLVAALCVAGFAIFGMLSPGGATKWRGPGVLVLEKETGTRYVYVGGELRPVLNYASARLIFEREPTVVSVSRDSLRDVPQGQPVGIVGAPDTLPPAGTVAKQVWTVCAPGVRDRAGTLSTATTLTIELAAASRRNRPLGPDKAIVATAGDDSFLIWRGNRLRLARPWLARVFGLERGGVEVEAGWLDSVPAGPDLAPIPVSGRGSQGPTVDGRRTRVGELFVARTTGAPERRYLLLPDGLAELTPVAYTIIAADPETTKLYGGGAVTPVELSPAALAQIPISRRAVLPTGVPESPPALAQLPDGTAWCVRHTMADGRVEIVADMPPTSVAVVSDGAGMTRTSRTATRIAVQPGVGGLMLAGRLDQAAGAGLYLMTDGGVKYPLASVKAAEQLGYPPGGARQVPRRLLELVPTGPVLESALSGG